MYDRNGDMMCLLENKVEEYYKLNGEYMVYSDMLEYGFTKREISRLVEKELLRKLVKGLYIYKNGVLFTWTNNSNSIQMQCNNIFRMPFKK